VGEVTLFDFVQAWIVVTSGLGILLAALKSRWGWVLLMAAQPGFLYATIVADQWGMFLNAVWWTGSIALGLWKAWRTT